MPPCTHHSTASAKLPVRWLIRKSAGTSPQAAGAAAQTYLDRGATVIYIATDGALAGLIALADVVRASAKGTVDELKSIGVTSILLTGDNAAAAKHIAAQAGIDQVRPSLLPEEKMRVIKACADKGEKICMIGDGINDALALRTAYAGIAMGGVGSDIAVEAADAVLVGDSI